ncbi:hypothetical protein Vadar_015887 [Vaccinium darrowii]|uniref:Uncharacterized protein n=9 Tax=Vaccinium darrowii TaxID=229202 RepID=A0ACB7YVR9_9ERIC|nr:hypothetical protein Vadar_009345 [Vaccinium darrowii]KAH7839506.1 hypothetical protein Vadar_005167 [Vaccinium darrowii]KAH7843259.1 hypothetical protein Vadar_014462 [Vaccinium darrowii]KAH7843854.1 hypothetical protein Vadar_021387 [Vaccinium darrowii]KAH7850769.1 hypothetical protein Vadar_002712 [Vaccinium darrowii]
MILNDSDSDDDLEFIAIAAMEVERLEAESSRRSKQRRTVIQRGHLAGQQRLFLDYFADQPVFPPNVFRRRFRMRRSLFLRIHSEVEAHDPYFVQKRNNAGVLESSLRSFFTAIVASEIGALILNSNQTSSSTYGHCIASRRALRF